MEIETVQAYLSISGVIIQSHMRKCYQELTTYQTCVILPEKPDSMAFKKMTCQFILKCHLNDFQLLICTCVCMHC